jgi:ParB-like chromosome segregation protein Spo0J
MEYHEYANIYRMLPDKELQSLAEDIKIKGQLLPITSYEGKILDGRNRYRACEIAGVDPKIEEYTGDDPLGLIASLNDHRRHDSDNERAMVGARIANLKAHRPKLTTPMGVVNDTPAISLERAAELSGSSKRSIQRARPIVQSGIPELLDMAESGEVSIRAASEVAKLPEEEQRKAVAGGVAGVKEAAKKQKAAFKSSSDSCESQNTQSEDSASPAPDTSSTQQRVPTYKPSEGMLLWGMAKSQLVRILKNDTQRVEALTECIAYCQERIQANK